MFLHIDKSAPWVDYRIERRSRLFLVLDFIYISLFFLYFNPTFSDFFKKVHLLLTIYDD